MVASGILVRPFAGIVRIRGRELMRRPVVAAAVLIQIGVLITVELIEVLENAGSGGVTHDLVMLGLRTTAAPGGLIFGVLAAAVVGSEFTWATERALLARDPRRLRFVALQLALVSALAAAWAVVQSGFAAGLGVLLQAQAGPAPGEGWTVASAVGALLAVLAVTEVYGLLGAACALACRGSLAGVVAMLAYGLLGELGLAPLWAPADGWTVYASAADLFEQQAGASAGRPLLVVLGAGVIALAASLTLYANREITR
jgi:ABC-type transport system involved in multi-copper enzyme maturation permease subunit